MAHEQTLKRWQMGKASTRWRWGQREVWTENITPCNAAATNCRMWELKRVRVLYVPNSRDSIFQFQLASFPNFNWRRSHRSAVATSTVAHLLWKNSTVAQTPLFIICRHCVSRTPTPFSHSQRFQPHTPFSSFLIRLPSLLTFTFTHFIIAHRCHSSHALFISPCHQRPYALFYIAIRSRNKEVLYLTGEYLLQCLVWG